MVHMDLGICYILDLRRQSEIYKTNETLVLSKLDHRQYHTSFLCIPGVRSCYDEGKRVAETLMFDYHRQHGIGN